MPVYIHSYHTNISLLYMMTHDDNKQDTGDENARCIIRKKAVTRVGFNKMAK